MKSTASSGRPPSKARTPSWNSAVSVVSASCARVASASRASSVARAAAASPSEYWFCARFGARRERLRVVRREEGAAIGQQRLVHLPGLGEPPGLVQAKGETLAGAELTVQACAVLRQQGQHGPVMRDGGLASPGRLRLPGDAVMQGKPVRERQERVRRMQAKRLLPVPDRVLRPVALALHERAQPQHLPAPGAVRRGKGLDPVQLGQHRPNAERGLRVENQRVDRRQAVCRRAALRRGTAAEREQCSYGCQQPPGQGTSRPCSAPSGARRHFVPSGGRGWGVGVAISRPARRRCPAQRSALASASAILPSPGSRLGRQGSLHFRTARVRPAPCNRRLCQIDSASSGRPDLLGGVPGRVPW